MFERLEEERARKLPRYALLSLGAHALAILCVALLAVYNSRAPEEKVVDVKFIGPGKAPGAAPPPPPAGAKKRPHKVVHKIEIPKVIETPKPVPVEPPKEEPKEEPEAEEGGKEGGVVGGVIGGVVGGTVGATGGGGTLAPEPPKEVKPKNVPQFVVARDAINTPPPRMTEVFRTTHVGQTLKGSYRVCIGLDGHIYDVIPVASIPGADEAMVEQIKDEWLYKPQKQPVCYLFPASVTIQ